MKKSRLLYAKIRSYLQCQAWKIRGQLGGMKIIKTGSSKKNTPPPQFLTFFSSFFPPRSPQAAKNSLLIHKIFNLHPCVCLILFQLDPKPLFYPHFPHDKVHKLMLWYNTSYSDLGRLCHISIRCMHNMYSVICNYNYTNTGRIRTSIFRNP